MIHYKTYLSLKKYLRAVYFDIYHSMQYDTVLDTNTNTFHVQFMSKNCTVFPPICLGCEYGGRPPNMEKEGFHIPYIYLVCADCWF